MITNQAIATTKSIDELAELVHNQFSVAEFYILTTENFGQALKKAQAARDFITRKQIAEIAEQYNKLPL